MSAGEGSDYSGPHTFTGQAPAKARESCFGCPAHDFLAKRHGFSCALGRSQTWWWSASVRLRVRPVQAVCLDQAVIDEAGRVAAAIRADAARQLGQLEARFYPAGRPAPSVSASMVSAPRVSSLRPGHAAMSSTGSGSRPANRFEPTTLRRVRGLVARPPENFFRLASMAVGAPELCKGEGTSSNTFPLSQITEKLPPLATSPARQENFSCVMPHSVSQKIPASSGDLA